MFDTGHSDSSGDERRGERVIIPCGHSERNKSIALDDSSSSSDVERKATEISFVPENTGRGRKNIRVVVVESKSNYIEPQLSANSDRRWKILEEDLSDFKREVREAIAPRAQAAQPVPALNYLSPQWSFPPPIPPLAPRPATDPPYQTQSTEGTGTGGAAPAQTTDVQKTSVFSVVSGVSVHCSCSLGAHFNVDFCSTTVLCHACEPNYDRNYTAIHEMSVSNKKQTIDADLCFGTVELLNDLSNASCCEDLSAVSCCGNFATCPDHLLPVDCDTCTNSSVCSKLSCTSSYFELCAVKLTPVIKVALYAISPTPFISVEYLSGCGLCATKQAPVSFNLSIYCVSLCQI